MSTPMKRSNYFDGEYVSLPFAASNTTEVDTGFALPKNSVIYPWEMFILVDTLNSGKTIDVGILSTESAGDANGFIAGLSLTTAGMIKPSNTLTQGTNAHYISATTWGVLFMAAACMGANTAEQNAVPLFTPYICATSPCHISYTTSSADTVSVGRIVFRVHTYPI